MNSDPTTPQGCHTLTLGGVDYTVETPPDLDALLDQAAARNPSAVDEIPYYAILWPAARGLATHLTTIAATLKDRNLIELGCGLGLPSIVAAHAGAHVLATDFHVDTGTWLMRNATRNHVNVAYQRLDWDDYLGTPPATPRPAEFVIGSDLVYEKRHIPALVRAIDALAQSTAIIADPGRDTLPTFVAAMTQDGWAAELIPVDDIFVIHFTRATLTES